ncbi:MAG: hydrogenase formation protein HypD [Pseudomonadota bacterium]
MNLQNKKINIMEVCGTHTMSIARHGIRSMLPEGVNLISGPGCPVCVTSSSDINNALRLATMDDVIITTFGDMVKVPCNGDSLQNYKNVKMVYSPLDSFKVADENKGKNIVFIGVGFETTAPLIASIIKKAAADGVKNISVLCMHKTVPSALKVILEDKDSKIDGLLLPGHVSAVTGSRYFDFIKNYNVPSVIAGFEPQHVMRAISIINENINRGVVVNDYTGVVSEQGNTIAMAAMNEVFEDVDTDWRGIGVIKMSGLKIRERYSEFDAAKRFELKNENIKDAEGCLCGNILMGKNSPVDCKYYGKLCTPNNPIGPCMVSSEGTCAAYYKYVRK